MHYTVIFRGRISGALGVRSVFREEFDSPGCVDSEAIRCWLYKDYEQVHILNVTVDQEEDDER